MWALFQPPLPSGHHVFSLLSGCGGQIVHFEQIRVFKAGLRLNTWAWNDINRFSLLVYWWWEGRKWERGMVGAIRTAALEVKFLDRCKTNNSESIWQERFHRSRTKVKGSKTIRYRRSLNYKLCRPGIWVVMNSILIVLFNFLLWTLWEIISFWVLGGVWSQGWNLKELTEGHHQE